MSNLLDRILITPEAQARWAALCKTTTAAWYALGLRFAAEDISEETAEMRGGKMVIYATAPPGRVEMVLESHEWTWAKSAPSVN